MIPPLSRYLRWKQAWRCLQITRRLDFSVNEQISYFKIQCPKQSWKLKIFINSYWSTIRNNLLYKKECYLCRKGIVKLTKCPPILHTPPSINGVVSTQTREWESKINQQQQTRGTRASNETPTTVCAVLIAVLYHIH